MEHQRHSDDRPAQMLSAEAYVKFRGSTLVDDLGSEVTQTILELKKKKVPPTLEQVGVKFEDVYRQSVSVNATLYPEEDLDGEVRINIGSPGKLAHELYAPYGSNNWQHIITSRTGRQTRQSNSTLNSYQTTDELTEILHRDILPLEFRYLDKEPSKRDLTLAVISLAKSRNTQDVVSQLSHEVLDYESSNHHLASREIKISTGKINPDTTYKQLLVRGYLALHNDGGATTTFRYYTEHDVSQNIQKTGILLELNDSRARFKNQYDINSYIKDTASTNGEEIASTLTESLKTLRNRLLY